MHTINSSTFDVDIISFKNIWWSSYIIKFSMWAEQTVCSFLVSCVRNKKWKRAILLLLLIGLIAVCLIASHGGIIVRMDHSPRLGMVRLRQYSLYSSNNYRLTLLLMQLTSSITSYAYVLLVLLATQWFSHVRSECVAFIETKSTLQISSHRLTYMNELILKHNELVDS